MQNIVNEESTSTECNSLDERPASQQLTALSIEGSVVIKRAPPRDSNGRTNNEDDDVYVIYDSEIPTSSGLIVQQSQQQQLEELSENSEQPLVISEQPSHQHLNNDAAFNSQDVHSDRMEDSHYPAEEEIEGAYYEHDSTNMQLTGDLVDSQLQSPVNSPVHSETTESDAPLEESARSDGSRPFVYIPDEERMMRHLATIEALAPSNQQPLKIFGRDVPIAIVRPVPRGMRDEFDQLTLVEIAAGPMYPTVRRALFGNEDGGEVQREEPPQEDSDDESDESDEEEENNSTFVSLTFEAVVRQWDAIARFAPRKNIQQQLKYSKFNVDAFEFLFLATKYAGWSIYDKETNEMHPPPALDWYKEPAAITHLRMLMYPIVFTNGKTDNEKIQRKNYKKACTKEIKKIHKIETVRRERDMRYGMGH